MPRPHTISVCTRHSCAVRPRGLVADPHHAANHLALELRDLSLLGLQAERDILREKPRRTSRRNRRDVRIHCKAPRDLAGGLVVRCQPNRMRATPRRRMQTEVQRLAIVTPSENDYV
jgi:hypothetical protein